MNDHFPLNEDLQTTLLSAFIQDRRLWVRMYTHIEKEYFDNLHNSRIFIFYKKYFERHKEFPPQNIMENALERAYPGEKDITETLRQIKVVYSGCVTPIKQDVIDYLTDECNKFIRDKKIDNALIQSLSLKEEEKYDDIEQVMREAVQWTSDVKLGTEIVHARERYEQVELMYDRLIKWPWERLNMISEGMFPKQLYGVAAASSVGKTIFCDNVAWHTWNKLKKNVVSLTTEISEVQKCQRMDSFGFNIPKRELRNKKSEIIQFYEDNKWENRLFIKEFPTGKAIIDKDVRQYLYNLELYAGLHPEDIDLIIFDSGNLFRPPRYTTSMYENIGANFEAIRAIAIEFDCATIASAQLGREVTKFNMDVLKVNEAFVSESYKIQQTCDWLVGLINTAEERANEVLNFKMFKDREGQKDLTLPMRIRYECLKIEDLAPVQLPPSVN